MSARSPSRRGPDLDTPERQKRGSDLGRRILFAIPAVIFALVIVLSGGTVFALRSRA